MNTSNELKHGLPPLALDDAEPGPRHRDMGGREASADPPPWDGADTWLDDLEEAAAGGVWDVASCWICGCTDDCACEGGCWWVPDDRGDLCSACEEQLIELEERLAQLLQREGAAELAEGLGELGLAALPVDGAVRLPGQLWLARQGEGAARWWAGRELDGSPVVSLVGQDLVSELAYRVVRAQQEAHAGGGVGDG